MNLHRSLEALTTCLLRAASPVRSHRPGLRGQRPRVRPCGLWRAGVCHHWGQWRPPLLATDRMTPSRAQSRAGPEPILARRTPSALPGLGLACSPSVGPVYTARRPGHGGCRPLSAQNISASGDSDATRDPHPSPRLGWAAPPSGHSLTGGSRRFEAPEKRKFPLTNPSSLSTQIVHALEPKRETFLMESPHFPNGEAEAWGG